MAGEKETRAVLGAIRLAYPGRFKFSKTELDAIVHLWASQLSDLRDGAALAACERLVSSQKHPPSLSDVRSEALSVRLTRGRPDAGDAWAEVTRAFGSVGRNRIPKWSSPAIARAVRAVGGWVHLCKGANSAADRARFLENYNGQIEEAERLVLIGTAPSIGDALELAAQEWQQTLEGGDREFSREVLGEWHDDTAPTPNGAPQQQTRRLAKSLKRGGKR